MTSSSSEPAASSSVQFNPLGLNLLSTNLRAELDARTRIPLHTLAPFPGAGLYALYYKGDLPLYEQLREEDIPIYVGKAEAGNSSYGDPPDETEPKLFKRIEKHRLSISETSNLTPSDFDVRYLTIDDVWIVLGERALLRAHSPALWNTLMSGFGSNPSGGARRNARSVWDSIHPGRPRAKTFLCNRKASRAEMEELISHGINISIMPAGPERDASLAKLRRRVPKIIWSEPANGDKDRRFRVYREDAFHEENDHFKVKVDFNEWRLAGSDTDGGDVLGDLTDD